MPLQEQSKGAVILISSNSAQMLDYNDAYMDTLLNIDKEATPRVVVTCEGQVAYGIQDPVYGDVIRQFVESISIVRPGLPRRSRAVRSF